MKQNQISLKKSLDDWLLKSGRTQEAVNEELVLTIAHDTVTQVTTDLQFTEQIALLHIRDYKVELPRNFRYVIQVLFKLKTDECGLKERVSEYMQSTLDGSGCNIVSTIECPRCRKTACGCGETFLEVDANRIWQDSHPELYTQHMGHFRKHGNTHHRSAYGLDESWKLIRRTSNNFFNIPYHINECINFNADSEIEYNIDHPHFIVNVPRGTIMLAYFGAKTDQDGLRLIPDCPEVFNAIFFSIEEIMALQKYIQSGEQRYAMIYERMKADAVKWRVRARNYLQIPEPDEWKQFIDNHWRRIIPYYSADQNFNRYKPESRFTSNASMNAPPSVDRGSERRGSSWTY